MINDETSETDFKKSRRRKAGFSNMDIPDRLPPNDTDAEQALLGCVMLEPKDSMGRCHEKFNGNSEIFYDLRNRTIFETALELISESIEIDSITMQDRLKAKSVLDQVGGLIYIVSLYNKTPSSANIDYYIDIVLEKFTARQLIQKAMEIITMVYEGAGDNSIIDISAMLDMAESEILSVRKNVGAADNCKHIKPLAKEGISRIEEFHAAQGKPMGLGTGLCDLDKMLIGLKNTDMIILAARPSMGKTSLAIQIAEHVAIVEKIPVGIFSLEMSSASLVMRSILSGGRVSLHHVQSGQMVEGDFTKITASVGRLMNAPIWIDDTGGISIDALRAKARRMVQRFGIKLFVIDYLQLAKSLKKNTNRNQEVADVSHGIKEMAKELNVPVIALAQLNRELEKNPKMRPNLSHLRESGDIEADADVVALLHRVHKEDSDGMEKVLEMELIIAKQRNGPTGIVPLIFMREFTRFEARAMVDDSDIPQ